LLLLNKAFLQTFAINFLILLCYGNYRTDCQRFKRRTWLSLSLGYTQTSETQFLPIFTRTQALPGDAYQEALPPIFLVTSATEFLASS
jgi:hypothetical protein